MLRSTSTKSARDSVIAVDVGTRMTKAVAMHRRGADLVLTDYVLVPTPVAEKELSVESLAEVLAGAVKALNSNCRRLVLTLGQGQIVLAHADLPHTSAQDLRRMIKLSPKSYLQQDLPDHLFDCYFRKATGKGGDTTGIKRRKSKVLVGAARRSTVEYCCEAARRAGLSLVELTGVPVALANAFRLVREDSHPDAAALLDVGASNSVINIVQHGELILTRMVALGADKFADVLSPGGKPGGAEEELSPEAMQSTLQRAILAFAREVDASAGFYTSQQEKHINQLFVSGGTARSQLVLQMLESELSFSCESWNLVRHLTVEMPDPRIRELEYEIPQLTVAIGAATGALREDAIRINLLAEEQALAEQRRRDPVRRGIQVAAAIVGVIVLAGLWLGYKVWQERQTLASLKSELAALNRSASMAITNTLDVAAIGRRVQALGDHGKARFLHGPALDAMQHVVPQDIELHRLRIERRAWTETERGTNASSKPIQRVHEQYVMTIQGRNYGDAESMQALRQGILQHPYFKERLRRQKPLELDSRQRRQSDPMDPDREFSLFTLQCFFEERTPVAKAPAARKSSP